MNQKKYIHGYTNWEQERLVKQAYYWKELILHDLPFQANNSILEIGCGVGAALGILGQHFEKIHLAGIDIQPEQIAFAKQYLPSLGIQADLRAGNASELPWPNATFDHIYMMWVVEHLADPLPVLREAWRVLKPGGSITITETDYSSIVVYPPHSDYDYFLKHFLEYFNLHGNAFVGRILGPLLEQTGFHSIQNKMLGMNLWNMQHSEKLANHIDYLAEFIEPLLPEIVEATAGILPRIQAGFENFQQLKNQPGASFSHTIYRAVGWKTNYE